MEDIEPQTPVQELPKQDAGDRTPINTLRRYFTPKVAGVLFFALCLFLLMTMLYVFWANNQLEIIEQAVIEDKPETILLTVLRFQVEQ